MSRFATRLAYGVPVDLALGCKVCRVPTSKTCNGLAGWLGMGWTLLLLLLPGAPILLPRADAVNLVVLFTLPTGCTLLELAYVLYSSFHTQCKLCSFLVAVSELHGPQYRTLADLVASVPASHRSCSTLQALGAER